MMINKPTGRLIFSISPQIENYLFYSNFKEIYSFMICILEVSQRMLNCSVFYMPAEYKVSFYQNKLLRDVLERIEDDPQTNIFFVSYQNKKCQEKVGNLFSMINGIHLSYTFLIKTMIDGLYPLVLDNSINTIIKKKCNFDDCTEICKDEIAIKTINTETLVTESFPDIMNKLFIDHKENPLKDGIQLLISFFCLIFEKPEEKALFDKLDFHDQFYNDINRVDYETFAHIVSSIVRAIIFPPSKTTRKEYYSIDWHLNKPSKINDYCIFRVDVLPIGNTGNGVSGLNRVIIGKKKKKKIILGFTSKHDIEEKVIKARLRDI